jgi:CRISPR-associated endonuclease/helicase Cas3
VAPDEARTLVVALAGLHDLGKFAPAFQAKAPVQWPGAILGAYRESYALPRAHTEDGYVLWDELLGERVGERLWTGGRGALDLLAPGVFGHHGRPVGRRFASDSVRQRFRAGSTSSVEQATACANVVLALLSPTPLTSPAIDDQQARVASWWVSGLLTLADWVGSNQRWFPYTEPITNDPTLARYWERATQQATRAVREAGLVPSTPSAGRSFAEIARVPGTATPVQAWASSVTLPEGPALLVIEDVTGSGKTEAAQMLVHRLLADGRALGAYWAMPTMATANAMYARQKEAIGALYVPDANGARPSLVLAHGQQRLHDEFRSTVLGGANDIAPRSPSDEDEELESSVACAAFLADDRRAALLADVGAGTVDQALLAALPSKFNTLRLFALADKVLVVDEAHAYDAYMNVEVQQLLRFHAALGGSAIVLSATLSRKQRAALAQAWTDGIAGGERRALLGRRAQAVELGSSAYPLATVVSAEPSVREDALEAAAWSSRKVTVRLVHDIEDALKHVEEASRHGGAVAWVRNTVDDCLDAAARLRERHVEPLVFHARFAQGDRQAREQEVMALFGKNATDAERRGRVLVATQVIEQSLDLDFDAMVSDVAPVDLLVQRAGRLRRHQARTDRGRPDGLTGELVVLSPERMREPPSDWLGGSFAGTAHVYENVGVLWLTVEALARTGCIDTPTGLRDLIESVYGSGEVPPSLLPVAQRAEGKESAHAATATYAVLKPTDGYHADAVAWVSDMRVPTRLGDARTTVRLARVRADGGLDPWVQSEGAPWKSWALSEVSVSAYRVPPGSAAEACYTDAVAQVRAQWGRFEQEIPVLPMVHDPSGEWSGALTSPSGKVRRIVYTERAGVVFPVVDSATG